MLDIPSHSQVILLPSKAHLQGHPGLIYSAPLAFMSTKNVSVVCAAT